MNPAAAIALAAAAINLATTALLAAVSRAPGWRTTRLFAALAFTAGLYNLCSFVFCVDGLDADTYLAAARVAYLIATIHVVTWVAYASARENAGTTLRNWRHPLAWLAGGSLAVGLVFAVTGLHLQPTVGLVEVAWAGVRYHYPLTTTAGDLYGLLMPALLAVAFVLMVRRVRRGERDMRLYLVALAVFIACVVDEVLVANRLVEFFSLADAGFVIVVLPLSVHVVRQIIADAKRLQSLTGKLAGEVRQRTEERDRAERALIESERLAALGRLAAGVGHEISNPLTYMQLALDEVAPHLERSAAPAAARSALEQAREGAFRIQKVVEGLRSYSRRQDERRSLDPRDVVRSALRVAGPSLRHVARIRTRFSAVPRVLGDEPRLVQAFVNLLTNAAQAVAEHDGEGVITVTTATGPHGEAQVIVADTGAGVAPGQLPRLSEPYFTTRGKSGGLGLGLFVTRGIVDAHAGQIEFASEPGEGMHVKVVLPPAPEAQPPEPEDGAGCSGESGSARVGYASASVEPAATEATSAVAGAASAPAGVGSTLDLGTPARSSAPDSQPFLRRLLLIDDEELVRQMLSRVLRRSWQVETASDGSAALEALEARRFDAVVCDLMMPGISGMDIAEELARRWPDLRVRTLFLTGGAITEVAERFLARPDVRYLTKPVQLGELDRTLNQLVDGSPMQIID